MTEIDSNIERDTLSTVDGSTILRIERLLAHPVEKVWRALTEPAHLSAWFPFDVQIELEVGAPIRFLDRNSDLTMDGEITELDPPRLLAFTWAGELLRWRLEPATGDTLLIFTQTFTDRAGAASFAAGWHTCLAALDDRLAGRPGRVSTGPSADKDVMHERYVAAFGLAEGTADHTPQGWRVRFERQLVRPIETVWTSLAGDEPPTVGAPVPLALTADAVSGGAVTEVEPPTLVEYAWMAADRPAGRVRWELSQGTGQGARLVLTQTGPGELAEEGRAALASWRARIEQLAAQLVRTARPADDGAGRLDGSGTP